MATQFADVIVVGGGVIGLTTALVLADGGRKVTLLEAGICGQEASWAGGGILMPLYPWHYPQELITLLNHSVMLTRQVSARLFQATGVDPEINDCGMSIEGLDHIELVQAQHWAQRAKWLLQLGADHQSVVFPTACNIRNPRYLKSLVSLLDHHQCVTIVDNSPVKNMHFSKEGRWSLTTPSGVFQANEVVCAAGAWSAQVLSASKLNLSIRPALGEMLLVRSKEYAETGMVLNAGRYLVPRKDGSVLIGSTVKYQGYEKKLSGESYEALLNFGCHYLGAEARNQVFAYWAGLRPDAGRSMPFIGPCPNQEGLWINTGHFRNGLVLAMGSAHHLADLMSNGYVEALQQVNPYGVASRVQESQKQPTH